MAGFARAGLLARRRGHRAQFRERQDAQRAIQLGLFEGAAVCVLHGSGARPPRRLHDAGSAGSRPRRGPRASSFDAPYPPRRCAFWTAGRTVRSKSSSSSRCRRCPRPPDKVRRDCPARASATSIGPTRDRVLERRRCHVCAGHRRGRRRSGYLHRCGARRAARAARGFGRSPVILWTRRDSLRRAQAARTARCSFSSSSRTARPSCDAR